jgi:hypothetical protein
MKIMLGYYSTSDGLYLGYRQPDFYDCPNGNYIMIIGTIRKKICENRNVSPYRHHDIIPHSKTYSDKNRLYIDIFEYNSYELKSKLKDVWRPWGEDESEETKRYDIINSALQNMINNFIYTTCTTYGITDRNNIYFSGNFRLTWPPELA